MCKYACVIILSHVKSNPYICHTRAGRGARGRRGARRACRDLAETQTDLAHLAGEILERTAPVGLRGRGEGKEQYKSLSTPIIFRPGDISTHHTI